MTAFSLSRVTAALLCLSVPSIGSAQVQKQRGATVGGLIGAVAGGLIGDHNDEAGAGAAIGGVVGAVTGGLLGDAADKEAAYRQQQYYQRQAYLAAQQQAVQPPIAAANARIPANQAAVTVTDIVSMTRSGLSDQVLINQINHRGVAHDLQVTDIISLHQQGVSELVITSMQNASRKPTHVTPAPLAPQPAVAPTPVIVEEHYLVPHYPPPHYRYGRRPIHHHHGFHIRF